MTSVFLCYSHAPRDKSRAVILEKFLAERGFDVFRDVGMSIGADWRRTIHDHLEKADSFLVLLSRASVASPFVQREIRAAGKRRRETGTSPQILPIRLDDVDLEEHYEVGAYRAP